MKNETMSPFQSQLMILQNATNSWYTLRANFSNPHADTLSQTSVSWSYASYVIIAKYIYPFRDIFRRIKKGYFKKKKNVGYLEIFRV